MWRLFIGNNCSQPANACKYAASCVIYIAKKSDPLATTRRPTTCTATRVTQRVSPNGRGLGRATCRPLRGSIRQTAPTRRPHSAECSPEWALSKPHFRIAPVQPRDFAPLNHVALYSADHEKENQHSRLPRGMMCAEVKVSTLPRPRQRRAWPTKGLRRAPFRWSCTYGHRDGSNFQGAARRPRFARGIRPIRRHRRRKVERAEAAFARTSRGILHALLAKLRPDRQL